MSRFMGYLFVCFTLLVPASWGWEFNTDGNNEGWAGGNKLDSVEVKDGNLVLSIKAGSVDPFISGPGGSWDGDSITGIEFRIRISSDTTNLGGSALYFFDPSSQHGSFDYKLFYPQDWNVVYIDFLNSPPGGDSPISWGGEISQIRLDFSDAVPEDYTVEIDWIRFVDERIENNNFEFGSLDPWQLDGAGSINAFQIKDTDYFSEFTSVQVSGLGSTQYHGLNQEIKDGLTLKKGQKVSVVGAVKIPADSWDSQSSLWFRIRESDGTNENLSPETIVNVFDEWFQFQSTLELIYEPAQRRNLTVQLYSKNPSGKTFYFDDIFVDVQQAEVKPIENPGWPLNAVKLKAGQSITIDGVVTPSEYQGAQPLVMNSETVRGIQDPYFPEFNHDGKLMNAGMIDTTLEDYNATYFFMWDDTNFYAGVSVQDDSYSFVGPDPNGADTLQFVFAETPAITQTANMYIPTISPEGPEGTVVAKNDFDGWYKTDVMGVSTFAGKVNPDTQDWTVEIKIPWSAMTTGFSKTLFPPKTGDQVGFTVLCIDYDEGTLGWFSANYPSFPWESLGVERMNFIDAPTRVSGWELF